MICKTVTDITYYYCENQQSFQICACSSTIHILNSCVKTQIDASNVHKEENHC